MPCICSISEIELLCWKTEKEKDVEVVRNFIKDAFVIELESAIKIKAAEIRKLYKIKLPDAIIAATSLIYNLTLITRNTKDFEDIEGLKILNIWNAKAN